MKFRKEVTLKDGRTCIIRSGNAEDAQQALDNFILTHGQTDFLTSYPDEITLTIDVERDYLIKKEESEREAELLAVIDGMVVGMAAVDSLSKSRKVRHRAHFGISIDEAFWGLGIGRALIESCIECARAAGYLQLELEVVSANERAVSLYRSVGFIEYGRNPKGFLSPVNGWQEVILMRLELSENKQEQMKDLPEKIRIRIRETDENGNSSSYDFDKIVPLEENPLKGKKICVLGSSVAFGAASREYSLAEYFSRRFKCDYVKEAVSGTTLCLLKDNSYIERMKTIDPAEHFDLFICQLSTNDATKGFPLGEIGTADLNTVTGAMEYIIRYVKQTWHCPIAFFTGSYYESENYRAMVERLMELKEEHDIWILDLWNDEKLNDLTEELRDTYMFDPIHPTKAGYRDWWCPELERQLLRYYKS
ncbi:MAG: GNAT family N-acetyltransferase [Erysipelotrichaceae bacterium]|nr:GNAT family N-acetyltransferase [Erysipelotrichaceae bacterium]